jgi:hypothetical protein
MPSIMAIIAGKIVKMAAKIVKNAACRHASDVSLWPASQIIASKRARKIQKRPVVVAGDMNVRGKMTPWMRYSSDKKAPPVV